MPGFAVVCNKTQPINAYIYTINKKGKLHTEQNFFFQFLYEKINYHEENQHHIKDDFDQRHQVNKQIFPGLNQKTKFKKSHTISYKNKTFQDLELNLLKEEQLFGTLSYDVFIYVKKSPCAECLNMYDNIQKSFPQIKIEVYYSFPFYYKNNEIVKDTRIQKLKVTDECLKRLKIEDKSIFEKGFYFYDQGGQERLINCINKRTIINIKTRSKNQNLSFYQENNEKILFRIHNLKRELGL